MEKDHLSIKKVVKNLRNYLKIKTMSTCSNSSQFVSCCSYVYVKPSYVIGEISNNRYFYCLSECNFEW